MDLIKDEISSRLFTLFISLYLEVEGPPRGLPSLFGIKPCDKIEILYS